MPGYFQAYSGILEHDNSFFMKPGIILIVAMLTHSFANAQWFPTQSTPNRGINPPANSGENCTANNNPPDCPTYNVSGMNWYVTAPDVARPITIQWSMLGNHDWVRSMPSGFIEWEDPDGLACINSEQIMIQGLGTVTANFAAVKFGSDVSSTDGHVNFGYRTYNGSTWSAWTNSPNFSIATTNTGGSWSAMASGQRMEIRACADFGGQSQDTRLTVFNTNLGSPLPVRWGNVYAELTGQSKAKIWWQTFTEVNNDYFEIQRSMNGDQYETVGYVEGAGNSHELKQYEFIDETVSEGKKYMYRIKQTDFDGQYDYSSDIEIKVENLHDLISIAPNPVENKLSIKINNLATDNLELYVYSVSGKKVKTIYCGSEQKLMETDVSELPSGAYFISSNVYELKQIRFIKTIP